MQQETKLELDWLVMQAYLQWIFPDLSLRAAA